MHKRHQIGFTLIELMIVVAIVAVIASIAVARYQSYVIRTQFTRIMSEVATQRSNIETCLAEGRTETSSDSENDICITNYVPSPLLQDASGNMFNGAAPPTGIGGTPTLVFTASDGGTEVDMTSVFGGRSGTLLHGHTLTWQRTSSGSWSCRTTMASRYVDPACIGT